MKIKQISVFVENQPGWLVAILEVLAKKQRGSWSHDEAKQRKPCPIDAHAKGRLICIYTMEESLEST